MNGTKAILNKMIAIWSAISNNFHVSKTKDSKRTKGGKGNS